MERAVKSTKSAKGKLAKAATRRAAVKKSAAKIEEIKASDKSPEVKVCEAAAEVVNNGAVPGVTAQIGGIEGEPTTSAAANVSEDNRGFWTPDNVAEKFDRLSKHHRRVNRAWSEVNRMNEVVGGCQRDVDAAKSRLKEAIADRDSAVVELGREIEDAKNGQMKLPGTDDLDRTDSAGASAVAPPVASPPGESQNWPISELGVRRLKTIMGAEAFTAARRSDDPVGLSEKQIEKLEAAEFATIHDLEKRMREDAHWFNAIAKDPAAKLIQLVVSSLLAFRKVHPQPVEEPVEAEQAEQAERPEKPAEAPEAGKPGDKTGGDKTGGEKTEVVEKSPNSVPATAA